jgi:hypothetical protein
MVGETVCHGRRSRNGRNLKNGSKQPACISQHESNMRPLSVKVLVGCARLYDNAGERRCRSGEHQRRVGKRDYINDDGRVLESSDSVALQGCT